MPIRYPALPPVAMRFVHSSTASHFDVVSTLLNAGVHVCVDKPLAENLRDAERLVELAARKN